MKKIPLACGLELEINDTGAGSLVKSMVSSENTAELNAAFNGLESLVLACACQGIDVVSEAFSEALDTAIDACINNHG